MNGKMKSEVKKRIGMTIKAAGAMRKVYESREISREAKVAVAVPTLKYGCESWVLKERESPGYRQQR